MDESDEILRLTDFMCVCSDDARAEAEACLQRVYEDLKCGPEDLLSSIVFALEWDLDDQQETCHAQIDRIRCDQWSLVSASFYRSDPEQTRYVKRAVISVQCDHVEHGIARVWELSKQAYAETGPSEARADGA